MLKSLQIEPEKCTGCLQCELACSYQAEGTFNPSISRIKVFTFHEEGRFVPYTCTQCEEAWCMHACPVEAIVLNPGDGCQGGQGRCLCGVQGLYHRLSLRYGQLSAEHRCGLQV